MQPSRRVAWASACGGVGPRSLLAHTKTRRLKPWPQTPQEPDVQRAKRSLRKRVMATLYSSSARTSEGFCGFVNACAVPL